MKKGNGSEARKASVGKIAPPRRPWVAAGFGFVGMLCLVALMDYEPGNIHESPPAGDAHLLGALGELVARHLFGILGIVAWLLPWLFCTAAFLVATETSTGEKLRKLITLCVIILSLSTLASLLDAGTNSQINRQLYEHGRGGSLGELLYSSLLAKSLGSLGASLFLSFALVWSLFLHWSIQPRRAFAGLVGLGKGLRERLPVKDGESSVPVETSKEEVSEKVPDKDDAAQNKKSSLFGRKKEGDDILFGAVGLDKEGAEPLRTSTKTKKKSKKGDEEGKSTKDSAKSEGEISSIPPAEEPVPIPEAEERDNGIGGFKVVRAAKTEKAANLFPERKGDYHFPTLDLLMDPPEEAAGDDEDHMSKALRLKETLSQFKIEVELGEVHTGPVITRYDIHPAAGVKVAKIATLEKDLAMALKAESVRILAPVPGKGCVGIEVPNDKPSLVCLKEILESKAWAEAEAEIPIVLGKVASGKPLVADLSKMPHLLVAGATGSGKTVCINTIIASLCYHSSPDDVRFIMVDPKIVEMKVYNALPHMLIPVVTEPKKVPGAIKWLLVEMERRYQIFSKVGARNIAGFNAKILKNKEEKEKALALEAEMSPEERAAISSIEVPRDDDVLEIPENKLPYIVFFIDELADLMMVAQAEVETGICRLAQLARASGIHLIIATQRPSVNVITGVIKANLPSRISFRVASFRDSQ
ncbi:MAG: DNA translocase FtsK, partial [Opitutales bacterium]